MEDAGAVDTSATKRPMLQTHTQTAMSAAAAAAPRNARMERIWAGIALLTLFVGEAGAGETLRLPPGSETFIGRDPPASEARASAALPAPTLSASGTANGASEREPPRMASFRGLDFAPLATGSLTEPPSPFSAFAGKPDAFALQDYTLKESAPREFRPRPHSATEAPAKGEDSLMDDRDTWQRLASEYRVQRRVRVLTLWDAGWSSVSLQAGKHGDPYLQWTGHLFGHSEAHRGVLDRWMPGTPGASAGSSASRGVVHALTAPLREKPSSSVGSRLSTALP